MLLAFSFFQYACKGGGEKVAGPDPDKINPDDPVVEIKYETQTLTIESLITGTQTEIGKLGTENARRSSSTIFDFRKNRDLPRLGIDPKKVKNEVVKRFGIYIEKGGSSPETFAAGEPDYRAPSGSGDQNFGTYGIKLSERLTSYTPGSMVWIDVDSETGETLGKLWSQILRARISGLGTELLKKMGADLGQPNNVYIVMEAELSVPVE